MKEDKKKIFIRTLGCQMNSRDSEALAGLFVERGYALADSPQEAEVILVNTCSVREHAEDRALSFLGALKRTKAIRNTQYAIRVIGLIGCMARNRGEEIFRKMPHIDIICSPAAIGRVFDYVERARQGRERVVDLGAGRRHKSGQKILA